MIRLNPASASFHQMTQVSFEELEVCRKEKGSLSILNMNGRMAVIAVEMHPETDKIVKVAHREFEVGASKEEISSFMSQLNRTHTYIYIVGGGYQFSPVDFPFKIYRVIDEYIDFPGEVTKIKIHNWYWREYHYEMISACLRKDGSLVYCLHDYCFND